MTVAMSAPTRVAPDRVRTVTCIGAGVIGGGWVAYFLAKGYRVVAWDPAEDAETRLRHLVEAAWPACLADSTLTEGFMALWATQMAMAARAFGRTLGREVTADDIEPVNWVLVEQAQRLTAVDLATAQAAAYAFRRAAPSGPNVMYIVVLTAPEIRRRRMRSSRSSRYGASVPVDQTVSERRASRTWRASRSAIDRPWPITGSFQPAASPISTAPGTTGGVVVHESVIGEPPAGPAGSPPASAAAAGNAVTFPRAVKKCSSRCGPVNSVCRAMSTMR